MLSIDLKHSWGIAGRSVEGDCTPHFIVIAGLDPAIHAAMTFFRQVSMDHRVKPGGDENKAIATTQLPSTAGCA
jgi:hypothetical protein